MMTSNWMKMTLNGRMKVIWIKTTRPWTVQVILKTFGLSKTMTMLRTITVNQLTIQVDLS
jgi:hypothetical protein